MGRTCSICSHPKIREIDAALMRGDAASGIVSEFRVKLSSLMRHKSAHLAQSVMSRITDSTLQRVDSTHNSQNSAVTDLLRAGEADEISRKKQEAEELGRQARAEGSLVIALRAIDSWCMLHKLHQQVLQKIGCDSYTINNNTQINVTIQTTEFLQELLAVLGPYPEARLAIGDYLRAKS